MSLSQKIDSDFLAAYKSKDLALTSTLRLLKSAIKNEEIAKKAPLEDKDVVRIIQKEIKQRKDSIEQYKAGNRPDLAEKDDAEISILNKYVPEQLGEGEITQILKEAISQTGASGKKDFGKVMGAVMPKLAGKADGALVSKILNSLLIDE